MPACEAGSLAAERVDCDSVGFIAGERDCLDSE
jgi:hypothetical protein